MGVFASLSFSASSHLLPTFHPNWNQMNLDVAAGSSSSSDGQAIVEHRSECLVDQSDCLVRTTCCMIDVFSWDASGRRCWSCGLLLWHNSLGSRINPNHVVILMETWWLWAEVMRIISCYLMRSSLQVEHTASDDLPGMFGVNSDWNMEHRPDTKKRLGFVDF